MTKIDVLDVAVWWGDDCSNWPSLTFLLDRMPEFGPYNKRLSTDGKDNFYWQECDGFASFFVWSGKPDDGFGGWRRTVQIDDGTEEEVVGGWSSRAEVAESFGHPATVPIGARTDYYEIKGKKVLAGGLGMHITHDRFRREVERLLPDVEVIPAKYGILTVKWRGQPSKEEFIKTEDERRGPIRDALKEKYGRWDWYNRATSDEQAELAIKPYSALGQA